MKISQATQEYVGLKQAMGSRFHAESVILNAFCRAMEDAPMAEVTAERVMAFIAGTGCVTRFWHRKHEALRGFYRFAVARGYTQSCPLDTPRESLERALAVIRSVLEEHDGMDADFPPRAFFTDYLPTAFNIRVIYWYNPPNYWDFLEMSEKVNLAIFRAFETEGIQFSLPARLAHTSVDSQEKPVEVKIVGETESE